MTNLSAIEKDWRQIGDTTANAFAGELGRTVNGKRSPLRSRADALYEAAGPHSALALAHMWAENQYSTTGHLIRPEHNNPMALRPGPGIQVQHQIIAGPFLAFDTPEDCVSEWKRRITDQTYKADQFPGGAYTSTQTLRDYVWRYNPPGDVHLVTTEPNDPIRYFNTLKTMLRRFTAAEIAGTAAPDPSSTLKPGGSPMSLNMEKGLIPLPPHDSKIVGRKNTGVSSVGMRTVRGESLHRAQGSFVSVGIHFGDPNVAALTDWCCDHMTGQLRQFNDPFGNRTGWASGPYNGGYGDGRAFAQKYIPISGIGAEVINRDRESVEVSGYFRQPGSPVTEDSPWSEASMRVLAQLYASRAHDYGIAWDDFPIARPTDEFSFISWHQEFILSEYSTESFDKICPGRVVMEQTDQLIDMVKNIMKAYQEKDEPTPDKPAGPEPGNLMYPKGMNQVIAQFAFGRVTGDDGNVYEFSPNGPVSRLWLDIGWAGGNGSRFPELAEVKHYDTRKYFRFSDGLLIWQPSKNEAVQIVGSEGPPDERHA